MRFIRKYQTCFAACLLAVYAFIATPVPVWHHHNTTPGKPVAAHKFSGKQEIHNTGDQASAGHCKICDHKYSPYEGEYFYAGYKLPVIYGIIKPDLCLTPIQDYYLNRSNKGPPAV